MSVSFPRSIMWFRRDLRLDDNTALAEATRQSGEVLPVFVFDSGILDALPLRDDRRVTFIHDSVRALREDLLRLGSDLVVLHGDPRVLLPELAQRVDAQAVFTNRDYEPAAKRRDADVHARLKAMGKALRDYKDQVVFEGTELRTGGGEPYRVFTPWKKAWLRRLDEDTLQGPPPLGERRMDERALMGRDKLQDTGMAWDLDALGFTRATLSQPAGSEGARRMLGDFLPRMSRYKDERDFPALGATSGLSTHLRFGTISVRTLMRAALDNASPGADTWLSELIWREFYQMIVDQFPHVEHGAFRPEYDALHWPGGDEHFAAWCEGRTGYPLVDAAMRAFRATGWMHNRLRMVVAMFLTKDLLVDWRRGERYFAERLVDFDLASNNGGWQWSASTGVDAAPYFRVFNPVLQSRRFDPDGAFIREHVPELRGFSDKHIHWPHDADMFTRSAARCRLGEDYPHPIVDHALQKEQAIAMFKHATPRGEDAGAASNREDY